MINEETMLKFGKAMTDDEVSEIVNKKAIPPKERDDRLFALCESCKNKCGQQKEFIKLITQDNGFMAREIMFGEGNERCREYKNLSRASDVWIDARFAMPNLSEKNMFGVRNTVSVDVIDTNNIYHRSAKHFVEGKTKVTDDYWTDEIDEFKAKYWKYVPITTRRDVDRLA